MKKKYYIWIILLFIVTISQAAPSIKDSLQNILQKTKEPTQRAKLLINILDLSDSSPDELEIARKLYTEGKKADDKMAIGASLSTLTIHYMQDPEKKDSLTLLLNEAEKLLENSDEEGLATYYKMTYKARLLQLAPRAGLSHGGSSCFILLFRHKKPLHKIYLVYFMQRSCL